MLGLVGSAVVLFAATNVDDIFVLIAFLVNRDYGLGQVGPGHHRGIGALVAASLLASQSAVMVPPAYIGLLGLVPVAIGLNRLWSLMKPAEAFQSDDESANHRQYGNVAAVAMVTVANGGDNLAIYTPVFATSSRDEVLGFALVFTVMTTFWVWMAHRLTQHPQIGEAIRRYGGRIVPWVFIALGVGIVYDAGTVEHLLR